MNSIIYGIAQGFKNIRRNKLFSMASLATMAACIFLFGILYFVLVNVQYIIEKTENNVGISVFFNTGISSERVEEIGEMIKKMDGVTSCNYLSAEDTWEYYKTQYLTEELAETFADDNPLEDSMSYTVFFDDINKQSQAIEAIKDIVGVRKVNDSQAMIATLSRINRALSVATAVIVVLLLSIATFLISTTVTMGVSVRRREISIMHLIGATDLFIKGPFLVEGIVIGLVGACIPLSFLYLVYYKVIAAIYEKFASSITTMNFVSIEQVFGVITPVSLIMGVGIGLLGSSFTLNKQLKRIKSL